MDLLNEMKKSESINLSSPGRCPANIDASCGPFFTEKDCTTGQCLEVTGMADPDSRDICNGSGSLHPRQSYQKEKEGVNEFMGPKSRYRKAPRI